AKTRRCLARWARGAPSSCLRVNQSADEDEGGGAPRERDLLASSREILLSYLFLLCSKLADGTRLAFDPAPAPPPPARAAVLPRPHPHPPRRLDRAAAGRFPRHARRDRLGHGCLRGGRDEPQERLPAARAAGSGELR